MGAVYLADHELLRRPAVIKLVRADRMSARRASRASSARCSSRARSPIRTRSPSTTTGSPRTGTPYYAMEYLEGVDLERLVEALRPLAGGARDPPVAPAVRLAGRGARRAGSSTATSSPRTCFCAARRRAPTRSRCSTSASPSRSRQQRVGLDGEPDCCSARPSTWRPSCSSPARTRAPQSDLYAVGCVAYFLLTGTPVFEGSTRDDDIGMAHLVERPDAALGRVWGRRSTPISRPRCWHASRSAATRARAALRRCARCSIASAIAHRWTEARAEAWWSEHDAAIEALDAEQADRERPPTLHRLRPRRPVY